MNKEQESKQKRKTPLTTIAISQEYAQKLDEYIKGFALTRKDFVELAIDYFLRTGFDIRGEAFDLSPLERITNRLESSAKVMEQHNEGTEAIRQLLQAVREQTAKQLPAPEIIAHAVEEKAKAESRAEEQGKKLRYVQEENDRLRNERLGRERGNMEAELPCAHDFRLDGRGNWKNPETEQAGYGGNADHTGGMPWHGKGHFFRP